MNKFIKALLVVIVLAAMPMKSWAQTPYRQYAEEGVVLDFFKIDNIGFRAFLLYNITLDDRFVLVPEEEYGQFVLTPKEESGLFMTEFESFYQNVTADFALLTKHDIYELMDEWKNSVASQNFLSITMDVALRNSRVDNEHCINSLPFCTTDLIEFEAACTSQTANEPGMDDGCIGSSYNPSWYHMRIHTGGQFIIHMEGHDPNTYQGRDIDFCMWGPYNDEEVSSGWACTHLTSDKIIDCNYSADPTEDVFLGYTDFEHEHTASHGTINYHMPEVGEYYILMITNFSQQPCVISFTKAPDSGPGETDCDILPGIVSNDGPYCEGETIHLFVNDQMNASYSWIGPNGFTSDIQNPVIPNCTVEMAGTYTCTTTVGTQTTTASTEVVIYQQATPSFTATTVCQGNPTQFNGIAGEGLVYHWDFGDGQNENGQSVAHTYDQAGTYQVTLLVTNEDGTCPGEITQPVTVNAQPVADAGEDQSLEYPGLSTTLNGSGGGTGYTYQWQPANMVVNPNSPTTQTVILYENQTYTLTVTNPQGGCVSTDEMTVYIGASPVIATAEATPNSYCLGESSQLVAHASGGSTNFSYSWTPATGLSATSIPNPIASPTQTTTYTCTITDNTTTEIKTTNPVTVTVYQHNTGPDGGHLAISNPDCDSVRFEWFGYVTYFKENGIYNFPNSESPEGQTLHGGCDTTMVVTISNMKYTPHPIIESDDEDVESPHYPITATEFNVNRYTYKITDHISDIATWNNDQCEWSIDKESWTIVPSNDNLSCTVYAMDWVEDTIWLSFKAVNSCSGEEGVLAKYWLKPSFYGIEESDAFPVQVDVIPNPNNGEMELRFENLEGRIQVKVCNASGTLIDSFEIQNRETTNTYNYTMKRLTNGVYFFTFSDGKRAITKKVVIIH